MAVGRTFGAVKTFIVIESVLDPPSKSVTVSSKVDVPTVEQFTTAVAPLEVKGAQPAELFVITQS